MIPFSRLLLFLVMPRDGPPGSLLKLDSESNQIVHILRPETGDRRPETGDFSQEILVIQNTDKATGMETALELQGVQSWLLSIKLLAFHGNVTSLMKKGSRMGIASNFQRVARDELHLALLSYKVSSVDYMTNIILGR